MSRKHSKSTLIKLGITKNNKETKELINALIYLLPFAIILMLLIG